MNAKNVGLLLLVAVFFASTGLAQNPAMIRLEVESPDENISLALPLSMLPATLEQSGKMSAMLEQTESRCDEIRARAQELSSKDDLTLVGTKHDSVSISVRKEDGIFDIKVADGDTTYRVKQPAAVFEAMFSSNSDCKLSNLPSNLSSINVPFLIVGEIRTSEKLQTRFRVWIEQVGQEPPPWL